MAAVGLLTLELLIHGSRSLKDKRQTVRALKDRLWARFRLSIAETGSQDSWQRSEISIAAVAADRRSLESVLSRVEEEAAELLGGDLSTARIDILQ